MYPDLIECYAVFSLILAHGNYLNLEKLQWWLNMLHNSVKLANSFHSACVSVASHFFFFFLSCVFMYLQILYRNISVHFLFPDP